MVLRKKRELFPNVSGVVQPTILWNNVFIRKQKAQCHGFQTFGHIVMKCLERRAPKARRGETKKNKKRQRKPGEIISVDETDGGGTSG